MSFNSRLTDLLKKDPRFVDDEGELLIAAVQDRAWKIDHNLVKLLLSDKEIKAKFFDEIAGHWVFNLNTFIEYVSQKNFLDNCYTRFRNRIGLTVDDKYLRERGDVALAWPYKDCVLEGGQTGREEKRKEIFFNEVLAEDEINRLLDPKVLTSFDRYTKQGKKPVHEFKRDKDGIIRENLIIKGNNLLALHSLKNLFGGQVNLIYVDPPFNTDSDTFGYNDSFNHSCWLTFMKNRLQIARDLLSANGSIYVHLDFNEVHYCKVLMDEIFQRENFQREIIWRMGWVSGYKTIAKNWIRNHDTLLFYTKNPDNFVFNKKYLPYPPDYERWGGRKKGQGLAIEDVWGIQVGEGINSLAVIGFAKEYTGFRTQKPESLLKRVIEVSSNPGDLVLDFCVGTGTTAAVAHKLGRQYIGIEQLDYGDKDSVQRLRKVIKGDDAGISKGIGWKGGGEFIYCELMKHNEAFLERIEIAKTSKELLKIWQEMAEGSFLNWYVNARVPEDAIKDFEAIGKDDDGLKKQKRLLAELLDKNQLYLNLSEIDDVQFKVSTEDKALNKAFYGKEYNG
jgi:adenine-specific DNA-methyltransferase